MKDYSKYFQNIESKNIDSSYGFITKLEVVGDEVHVWTPQTKKGEPRKYSIKQLPVFLEKLEMQYQTIINNEETIKKDYMKPRKRIIITTAVLLIVALMTKGASLMFAESLATGLTLLIASPIIGTFLTAFGVCKVEEKFDQELDIYQDFLEKRIDIERQAKVDKNITENLSRRTINTINSNEELKKANKSKTQVYDIDFMDKASLKELKKLIENYNQSKSLFEEQVFVNPNNQKEQPKIRKLKNN